MSLSVGIVGLPNAGKSTLFNALAARRLAETAPRPFTTIEPHEAVVPVPDGMLEKLWELVKSDPSASLRPSALRLRLEEMTEPEKVPAAVTFIDIAGLVKNAHKGEGLGNQFLAKIREANAIIHVVRGFEDPAVSHPHPAHEPGSSEQMLEDIEIVDLEIELGGIEKKPTIYVLNLAEQKVTDESRKQLMDTVKQKFGGEVVAVSAKLEEELIDLVPDERRQYLDELGIKESGLEQTIRKAYELLGLVTFYTIKGGKEVHAWSVKNGSSVIQAAAKVHTDFAKDFIKAEVINVSELLSIGSWKDAKEKGKVRLEGRDYVVADGDVVEFKTS